MIISHISATFLPLLDVSFRYNEKSDWLFRHLEFGIDMSSRWERGRVRKEMKRD